MSGLSGEGRMIGEMVPRKPKRFDITPRTPVSTIWPECDRSPLGLRTNSGAHLQLEHKRFRCNLLGDCLSRIHRITLPAEYRRGDPPQVAAKNLTSLDFAEIGVKNL
jgi:hypothetical protein